MKTMKPIVLVGLIAVLIAIPAVIFMATKRSAPENPEQIPEFIAEQICDILKNDGDNAATNIYRTITKYGQFNGKPSNKDIIDFLNKNKLKMMCGKMHYFLLAIKEGQGTELFIKLFLKTLRSGSEGNPVIDVNISCPCGPNGETQMLLDYAHYYIRSQKQNPVEYRQAIKLEKVLRSLFFAQYYREIKDPKQTSKIPTAS